MARRRTGRPPSGLRASFTLLMLASCMALQLRTGAAAEAECLLSTTATLSDQLWERIQATLTANSSKGALTQADLTVAVRDGLVGFAGCMNVSLGSQEPIRIMVSPLGILPRWQDLAAKFEQLTGIKVVFTVIQSFWTVTKEILYDVSNTRLMDAWIFEPSLTGSVAAMGGFADLAPFIQADPAMQFSDYNRFYREVSAVYGKRVVGLPLDGDLFLMYYRTDYLARLNLTVPRTWDDLLAVAKAAHGNLMTEKGPLNGACFNFLPDRCQGQWLASMVAASYLQYEGTHHGFMFDPNTIPPKPLADNEGMLAALRFWRDMRNYTRPSTYCVGHNVDFHSARCLLTIGWGDNFKMAHKYLGQWPSLIGMAPLPGSTQVVDRSTGKLVPCTPTLCPYAQEYTNPRTGEQGWVNTVPFAALGGWTGAVSAFSTPTRQLNAFRFLAFISSPANSWVDILDTDSGIDPFRDEHLTNMARWVNATYDWTQTNMYFQAIQASLSNPNIALDTRLAYDAVADLNYWDPYNRALLTAINLMGNSTDDALWSLAKETQANLTRNVNAAVTRYMPNRPVDLTQQYWDILGKPGLATSLLPSPPSPIAADTGTASSTAASPSVTLAAALGAVGFVGLVAAVATLLVVMRRSRRKQHRNLMGQVLVPGLGVQTTLVITDVQDSTLLFEVLPVSIMDQCMQLLCGAIRALLAKHNGYESATEGDSFILAFHSAQDALCFCVDLQVDLLAQLWPQELLEVDGVPSVHSTWALPLPKAVACTSMMLGRRLPTALSTQSSGEAAGAVHVHWASMQAKDGNSEDAQRLRSGWLGRLLAGEHLSQASSPLGSQMGNGSPTPDPLSSLAGAPLHMPALKSIGSFTGHSAQGPTGGAVVAEPRISTDTAASPWAAAPGREPQSDTDIMLSTLRGQHPPRSLALHSDQRSLRLPDMSLAAQSEARDTIPTGLQQRLRTSALSGGGGEMPRLSDARNSGPYIAPDSTRWSHGRGSATNLSGSVAVVDPGSQARGSKRSSASGRVEQALSMLSRSVGGQPRAIQGVARPHTLPTLRYDLHPAETAEGEATAAAATRQQHPRTVRQALEAAWQLTSSGDGAQTSTEATLVWHGLRVRCSVASGLDEQPSRSSQGRAVYTGTQLMALARALEACAHGGQVLLAESTVQVLGQAPLPDHIVLVHMGKHAVSAAKAPPPLPAPATPGFTAPATGGTAAQVAGTGDIDPLHRLGKSTSHAVATDSSTPMSLIHSVLPSGLQSTPANLDTPPVSEGLSTGTPEAVDWTAAPTSGPAGVALEEDPGRALNESPGTLAPLEGSRTSSHAHTTAMADMLNTRQTSGMFDEEAQVTYAHVYGALHVQHLPRLTTLPPLRVTSTLVLDVLHAPLDVVTISFMYMPGFSTLRGWDTQEATAAQELFANMAKRQLWAAGGYLVEIADGFLLTAFSDPHASLRWALAVQSGLHKLPWSTRLLAHELCEEVQVMQPDGKGGARPMVLFRGPRIKVGMDMGATRSEVHATLRRMAYRGRVMNRAARIASTAHSGQVLCSQEVWVAAARAAGGSATNTQAGGLTCIHLGAKQLKGIKEPMSVCQVTQADKSIRRACRNGLVLADSFTNNVMNNISPSG